MDTRRTTLPLRQTTSQLVTVAVLQCQRNGFDGPVIGARPTERNVREFSDEQMKAGETIIGLQAGTNRCATQAGMSIGGVRHVADIKADNLSRQGTAVIGLQASSDQSGLQHSESGEGQHNRWPI